MWRWAARTPGPLRLPWRPSSKREWRLCTPCSHVSVWGDPQAVTSTMTYSLCTVHTLPGWWPLTCFGATEDLCWTVGHAPPTPHAARSCGKSPWMKRTKQSLQPRCEEPQLIDCEFHRKGPEASWLILCRHQAVMSIWSWLGVMTIDRSRNYWWIQRINCGQGAVMTIDGTQRIECGQGAAMATKLFGGDGAGLPRGGWGSIDCNQSTNLGQAFLLADISCKPLLSMVSSVCVAWHSDCRRLRRWLQIKLQSLEAKVPFLQCWQLYCDNCASIALHAQSI